MNKNKKVFLIILVILIIGIIVAFKIKPKTGAKETFDELSPVLGEIRSIISTTGTVLPKNRLEIKPPVGGRVDSVLVKEGEKVKVGQILAWMSSTERAALLDAAASESAEKLKYWQDVYKPIALVAPLEAEVIVATVQPGQTITTAEPVVVLSDHLIARAQVDETDISKVELKQKAIVGLDAYPLVKIKSVVEHIYYESKTINNVTVYEVDLMPLEDSSLFRSGMNASIDFIINEKENILTLPLEAITKERDGNFVLIKQNGNAALIKLKVELGISDNKFVEIKSGLSANDVVLVKSTKYSLPKSSTGANPFMPSRARGTAH